MENELKKREMLKKISKSAEVPVYAENLDGDELRAVEGLVSEGLVDFHEVTGGYFLTVSGWTRVSENG